jgi:hypothetical protein
VRTCTHRDSARDLPEDVLRLYAALNQVRRYLNDKDVVYIASQVDVARDADGCDEGVDTRRQRNIVEDAIFEIEFQASGPSAPRGVGVRSLHVADRGGQIRRNGSTVARGEGLASDLRGQSLIFHVFLEAEASHGGFGDG